MSANFLARAAIAVIAAAAGAGAGMLAGYWLLSLALPRLFEGVDDLDEAMVRGLVLLPALLVTLLVLPTIAVCALALRLARARYVLLTLLAAVVSAGVIGLLTGLEYPYLAPLAAAVGRIGVEALTSAARVTPG